MQAETTQDKLTWFQAFRALCTVEGSGATSQVGSLGGAFNIPDSDDEAEGRELQLWTWGANELGQLAIRDRSTTGRAVPQLNTSLKNRFCVRQLSVGFRHAGCVVADGSIFTWGDNSLGQLGCGEKPAVATKAALVRTDDEGGSLQGQFKQISCGRSHTLALLVGGGQVAAWGTGKCGELGLGPDCLKTHRPRKIDAALLCNVWTIAAGGTHSGAIDTEGNVKLWGCGEQGQLANGSYENAFEPVAVPRMRGQVKQLDLGATSSGFVNIFGQVFVSGVVYDEGDKTTADPLEVLELKNVAAVSKVSCSEHHIIALDEKGRVFAWGRGYASGMEGPNHSPHQLPLPEGAQAIGIWTNETASFALCKSGLIYSWGCGSGGQLGTSVFIDTVVPEFVRPGQDGVTTFQELPFFHETANLRLWWKFCRRHCRRWNGGRAPGRFVCFVTRQRVVVVRRMYHCVKPVHRPCLLHSFFICDCCTRGIARKAQFRSDHAARRRG
eukprot:INCI12800.1.p1 GENE.INCI12800.1~~INCI12800.1.p1  ORF type:complete len:496 (+),score=61.95 INCI12800.1:557-2044(+)